MKNKIRTYTIIIILASLMVFTALGAWHAMHKEKAEHETESHPEVIESIESHSKKKHAEWPLEIEENDEKAAGESAQVSAWTPIDKPKNQDPIDEDDRDCPYYQKKVTEEPIYGSNDTYTLIAESLFGCPSESNAHFGTMVIRRSGQSGHLDGNYEYNPKDYVTDKCFATFTDQDTGMIYYQLYREKMDGYRMFDGPQEYIVVSQDVFDRLTKDYR